MLQAYYLTNYASLTIPYCFLFNSTLLFRAHSQYFYCAIHHWAQNNTYLGQRYWSSRINVGCQSTTNVYQYHLTLSTVWRFLVRPSTVNSPSKHLYQILCTHLYLIQPSKLITFNNGNTFTYFRRLRYQERMELAFHFQHSQHPQNRLNFFLSRYFVIHTHFNDLQSFMSSVVYNCPSVNKLFSCLLSITFLVHFTFTSHTSCTK